LRDQYTEVTQVSWGEKLQSSCLGSIFALIAFVLSFYLLFWNEGRVNLAQLAKTASDISTLAPADRQGQLVTVTGAATAKTLLGDGLFLRPGPYVLIDRTVEMYAWREDKQTRREKHVGGSETEVTTYTYSSAWTDQPGNSSQFGQVENHQNPPKALADELYQVPSIQIGRYSLDLQNLRHVSNHYTSCQNDSVRYTLIEGVGVNMPKLGLLPLQSQNTQVSGQAVRRGDYIFQGTGTPDQPRIGDVRVCYRVLPTAQIVTALGQLTQAQITPYLHRTTPVHRLIPGTRAAAIALLGDEEMLWRWALRGMGFALMWWSLTQIGAPLVALFDVLPWLGWIAESATSVGSLIAAFMLSSATILVSSFVHHPIVLASVLGMSLGILWLLGRFRR
jgi:Transmembrane protein 43